MASQVEPLRDNFDLLGGVKLLDSLSRSTLRSREPQESTAQQLSFEKSHFRISSTVRSKGRTTVFSIIQHHRKVLLSSFHLNGHTLGFHPQTLKLEPPCTAK